MTFRPHLLRVLAALLITTMIAAGAGGMAWAQDGDPPASGSDGGATEPTDEDPTTEDPTTEAPGEGGDGDDVPPADANGDEDGDATNEDEDEADDPDDPDGNGDDDEADCRPDDDGDSGPEGSQDDEGTEGDRCAPAPEQVSLANLVSPAPAAVDLELQAALTSVGFLDTWYAVTPTHPRLSLVTVTGPEADRARQDLLALVDELIENRETTTVLLQASQDLVVQRRTIERAIDAIDETITDLARRRNAAERIRGRLEVQLEAVITAIQGAAVGVYVSDTDVNVGSIDDVEQYNAQQQMVVTIDATLDELLAQRAELESDIAAQEREMAAIEDAIALEEGRQRELAGEGRAVEDTIQVLSTEITALTERRIAIEAGMPQTIGELHRARLLATAPALQVPLVTLDAYVQSADAVRDVYPTCVVRWELLAGIAKVESAHATFGGATVAANGDVSLQILGPLLDGTLEDTAVITDTDQGALDGNDEFDAAVGPFQFIPSTWARHGLDATGDGFADPHNLYDAGLSAAGYLCASSNLADDPQIARSVLSYNRSQQYLADVTGFARTYIVSLALPAAAFDPETIDARDGWGVHFEEVDPFAQLGMIGPADDDAVATTEEEAGS